MGDGALAPAERLDEIAHADLAAGSAGEHGEDSKANGVAEGIEPLGEKVRLVSVQWGSEHGRAAFNFLCRFDHSNSTGSHTVSH